MARHAVKPALATGCVVFSVLVAATVLAAVLVSNDESVSEDNRVLHEERFAAASLQQQAADRLAATTEAVATRMSRLPVFAYTFTARNRTQPMSQADIDSAMVAFSKFGGATQQVATLGLLAYVTNDERASWEAEYGRPIERGIALAVGGVVSETLGPNAQPFYLPYVRYVPAAPYLHGYDFMHGRTEWVAAANMTLDTGEPAPLSPRTRSGAWGIPLFQRVPTSDPGARVADAVYHVHMMATAFEGFLGNSPSSSVVGAMYDITDGGRVAVVEPELPHFATKVDLAHSDYVQGGRTWRFEFYTTQAAVAAAVDTTRSSDAATPVWAAGMGTAAVLGGLAAAVVYVWIVQRHSFKMSVASNAANSTHERLISVINHELRGPLTVIKCGVDLAKEEMEDAGEASTASLLGNISHAATVIEKVLKNVLAVADLQRAMPPPQSVPVRAWLRDTGNEIRALLCMGLTMRITLAANVPPALLTHGQLLRKCCVALTKKVVASVLETAKSETHVSMRLLCPTPGTVAVVIGRFRRRTRHSSLFGTKSYSHRHTLDELARLRVPKSSLTIDADGLDADADTWADLSVEAPGRRVTLTPFRRANSNDSGASSSYAAEEVGVELRQVLQLAAVLGGVAGAVEHTAPWANLFVVLPAEADHSASADAGHTGVSGQTVPFSPSEAAGGGVGLQAGTAASRSTPRMLRWRSTVLDESAIASNAPPQGVTAGNGSSNGHGARNQLESGLSASSDDISCAQVTVDVGVDTGTRSNTLPASTFFVGHTAEQGPPMSPGGGAGAGDGDGDLRQDSGGTQVPPSDAAEASDGSAGASAPALVLGERRLDSSNVSPRSAGAAASAKPTPSENAAPASTRGSGRGSGGASGAGAGAAAAAAPSTSQPEARRSRRSRRARGAESKQQPTQFAGADVVVVDDERVIVKMVMRQLARLGVGLTHSLDDGIHLMDHLESRATLPSAILLDITMPQSDGVSVCKLLRSDRRFANVPVYAMTANVEGKASYELAGFTGLLGKPFSKKSLSQVLQHSQQVVAARNAALATGVESTLHFAVFGATS